MTPVNDDNDHDDGGFVDDDNDDDDENDIDDEGEMRDRAMHNQRQVNGVVVSTEIRIFLCTYGIFMCAFVCERVSYVIFMVSNDDDDDDDDNVYS